MTGSEQHTPTLDEAREAYVLARDVVDADSDNGAEFDRMIAQVRAEARNEALRDAAGMIPSSTEPENPFTYDPWDDHSVDPSNTDDVVHGAVSAGWSMGAYRAREEARTTILAQIVKGAE